MGSKATPLSERVIDLIFRLLGFPQNPPGIETIDARAWEKEFFAEQDALEGAWIDYATGRGPKPSNPLDNF